MVRRIVANEVKIGRLARHKNLIRTFGCLLENADTAVIVMEYVSYVLHHPRTYTDHRYAKGITLHEYMSEKKVPIFFNVDGRD